MTQKRKVGFEKFKHHLHVAYIFCFQIRTQNIELGTNTAKLWSFIMNNTTMDIQEHYFTLLGSSGYFSLFVDLTHQATGVFLS